MTAFPLTLAKTASSLSLPAAGLSLGGELISNVFGYMQTAEIEKTKREAIKAERNVKLAEVEANYKNNTKNINKNFRMKNKALKKVSQMGMKALEQGKDEITAQCIEKLGEVLTK
jgi:hypothetical protein